MTRIDRTQQICNYLATFCSEHKKEVVEKVLASRTSHLTVVLEAIFQPHNISAALRSAECFGVQNVHIVEHPAYQTFKAKADIARGAADWITLTRHATTVACVNTLKKQGFTIVATSPHPSPTDLRPCWALNDLPINNKPALLFGTEISGISADAIALADAFVTIPMVGFTESLNISVSVAICLYDLCRRLRAHTNAWVLSEEEKMATRLAWYRSIVSGSAELERRFILQLDAGQTIDDAG